MSRQIYGKQPCLCRCLLFSFLVSIFTTGVNAQEVFVRTVNSVAAGGQITIEWQGPKNSGDYITVVEKGAAPGSYNQYVGANRSPVKLTVPEKAGSYEVRYVEASSDKTLAFWPLDIQAISGSIQVIARASSGTQVEVTWTGPANPTDYITVVKADAPEGSYTNYQYTKKGSPLKLQLPDENGDYQVRYVLGQSRKTLAFAPLLIQSVSAQLEVPESAKAGSQIKVDWQGPGNPRDFITIVKVGAPEKTYQAYTYTKKGSPLSLLAPDESGEYEIRYLTGQSYATLASAPIKILATTASLQAPTEVSAGTNLAVTWNGPGYVQDFVTLVKKGAKDGSWGAYGMVKRGNPVVFEVPRHEAGDYELRYLTGQSYKTLARLPIKVLPATQLSKFQVVSVAEQGVANAVAIILDASGSMLKQVEGGRRIDIARQALQKLIADTLPQRVSVSLRAFGHIKSGTCDGELVEPLKPLDRDRLSAAVVSIQPKNLAKTPIAASLQNVASDLASAKGQRLVILVTDGEETCDGDPKAAILKLREQDLDVSVNIVGFAIDEAGLKHSFSEWAMAGGGHYVDAFQPAQLQKSVQSAFARAYQLKDSNGNLVASGLVNGEPLELMAGEYQVQVGKSTQRVILNPGELKQIQWQE